MEWIDVKEKQPDGECLAIGYQNEMLIGYISTDRIGNQTFGTGFLCSNDHENLTHVTHWTPLPEPPKNKSK